MSSNFVTEKSQAELKDWQPLGEQAPSYTRPSEPTFIRIVGMVGIVAAVIGTMAIGFILAGRPSRFVGVFWGSVLLETGLLAMLLHAATDRDVQIRRTYTVFGFLLLACGMVLSLLAIHTGSYFIWGFPCLVGALLFLAVPNRHETEADWRNSTTLTLGAAGAALALTGFIGGNIGQFLTPVGLLLGVLGLAYLCCFVVSRGVSDNLGYWGGIAMGAVGIIAILVALGRSVVPSLLHHWRLTQALPPSYFLPNGFLLMSLGLIYAGASAMLCSDNRLLVMTRRELAGFFYSPVAYIAFLVWTVVGGLEFMPLVQRLTDVNAVQPIVEPVVGYYFLSWMVVIGIIFVVPMLTMRLLSEEKRSGTLEVMLTAPVGEVSLVLSKFLAASLFFVLLSLPWGIYLLSLRVGAGQPFDYLPLLSFTVVNLAIGAGLMAMGLFFSAVTQHQVISFALTFAMMLAFTAAFLFLDRSPQATSSSHQTVTQTLLRHISYIQLWISSLNGQLQFKYVVFHLTAAVFWLFATVKVMDMRKWA